MFDVSTITANPLRLPSLVFLSWVCIVPSMQPIDGHLHARSREQGDAEAHVASDGAVSMPPLRETREHTTEISVTARSLPYLSERSSVVNQQQKAPMVRSVKSKEVVPNGEVYISAGGEVSAPTQAAPPNQELQALEVASIAALKSYDIPTKADDPTAASPYAVIVHCKWGKWSKWSVCSEECEGGDRHRKRLIVQHAKNGGGNCKGPHQQTEACNEQDCPTTEPPETTTTAAPAKNKGASDSKKGTPAPAPAPSEPQSNRNMMYVGLGAVVILASIAGLVFYMQQNKPKPAVMYDEFGEPIDAVEPNWDDVEDDGQYGEYS